MSRVLYFAYGSNMLQSIIESRIGEVKKIGVVILNHHKLLFNKKSMDGTAKANIVVAHNSQVHGVLYNMHIDQANVLRIIEVGYSPKQVITYNKDSGYLCFTFIANKDKILSGLHISYKYMDSIMRGADENGIPRSKIMTSGNQKLLVLHEREA